MRVQVVANRKQKVELRTEGFISGINKTDSNYLMRIFLGHVDKQKILHTLIF